MVCVPPLVLSLTARVADRVDLDKSSATLVGLTGVFLEGLVLSPDGRLFGTDTGGNLYQINTTSGAATLVGNTGCGCDIKGLHFFGSMLVGVGLTTAPPVFFSINTQTGASTTLVTANSSTGAVRAMTPATSTTRWLHAIFPSIWSPGM
jgi:hypothetical protein